MNIIEKLPMKSIFHNTIALTVAFIVAVSSYSESLAQVQSEQNIKSRNVLIINSYHSSYKWTQDQTDGFIKEVILYYPDVQFYTEFIDAKRMKGRHHLDHFAELLTEKYKDIDFELIYTTDDVALAFTQSRIREFSKADTPIVASGVNNVSLLDKDLHPTTIGLIETQGDSSAIVEILRENPKADKIIVIADYTEVGDDIGDQIEKNSLAATKLPVIRTPSLSFDQLIDYVKTQDSRTIFMIGLFTVDSENRYVSPDALADKVAAYAAGPVYVFNDLFNNSPKIVGGYLNTGKDQGHAAAQLGLQILDGKPLSSIASYGAYPQKWVFHYEALRRFGISRRGLPEKSIVHGVPENLFLDHLGLFCSVIIGIAAQTFLIFILLNSIRKRKIVTRQLRESEAQFRMLIEHSPLAIYIADAKGRLLMMNKKFKSLIGYDITEVPTIETLRLKVLPDPVYRNEITTVMEKHALAVSSIDDCPAPFEFRARTATGEYIEVEMFFAEAAGLKLRIINDVTQRNRIMSELKTATTNAMSANEAKSRFLANVSHEIRTPMNGIMGMVQLLLETRATEEQRSYLTTVNESCNLLLTVINDILDISKIEAGCLNLIKEPVELLPILRSVSDIARTTIEERSLDFVCDFSSDLPKVISCDAGRLKQILLNLLINASKFTDKGYIKLRVFATSQAGDVSRLSFEVVDTGIGVAPDQVQKVFEPFIQADNSNTRKHGGTGLGLPICRKLVRLMGGELEARSQLGKGSTFSFSIDVDVLHNVETKVGVDERIDSSMGQTCPLSILVAEDNLVNQKVIGMMLKKMGYKPVIVSNGREALDRLVTEHFDVVFMDVQMPIMDGLCATEAIRNNTSVMKQPYIIALTAHALSEDVQGCLRTGMNSHLTKPIRAILLRKVLAEAYRDKHMATAVRE